MRGVVSGQQILLAILIASMLLAVWVDVRLGDRSPSTLTMVVMHGIGAFAVVQAAGILGVMAIAPHRMLGILVGLLLIVLPAWVYAFLAMIWATKLARNAIRR
jgi:hypothetical protein